MGVSRWAWTSFYAGDLLWLLEAPWHQGGYPTPGSDWLGALSMRPVDERGQAHSARSSGRRGYQPAALREAGCDLRALPPAWRGCCVRASPFINLHHAPDRA